jgi:hypothetical protein
LLDKKITNKSVAVKKRMDKWTLKFLYLLLQVIYPYFFCNNFIKKIVMLLLIDLFGVCLQKPATIKKALTNFINAFKKKI